MPRRGPRQGWSDVDRETVEFVSEYIRRESRPPTYTEIANHFGIALYAVQNRLYRLEAKGYIEIGEGARAIRILKYPPEQS